MRFLDNRRHTDQLPASLVLLIGHLLIHSTDAQLPAGQIGQWIKVSDYDQVIDSVVHLQLNFEPVWLDEEFRAAWRAHHGTILHSQLLENTAWKRFAWGVWVEP